MLTFWREQRKAADRDSGFWACSDTGAFMAVCKQQQYGAVFEDRVKCYREPSALGCYVDYTGSHRSPHEYCHLPVGECSCPATQPGSILCVTYESYGGYPGANVMMSSRISRWVETIEEAKAWVEQQVRKIRPELFQEAV